ncbi:hypothetical protein FANTH_13363 [Fusarium anthophilum]|uniref:Uncharacterized protein n=1 Tax=Fusarium anthophilum TaxID=48485 RepID=A0A8H5DQ27_9HYPO|nr:hypothetical protein FANTH_13363 [Fusarium anthophilum]
MEDLPPEPRTVALHDIPKWRRGNKYILAGYRPLKADYRHVIKSLNFLHNETWNIYTHLIGAVLLLPYATTILRTIAGPQYINVTGTDFIMFNIFFCSAESCLTFSAVYHLFGSHSYEVEQLWHQRDLLGIVILTVGTFIPGIYYIFYCNPSLERFHWTVVIFCGSATAAFVSISKFRTLRWRKARIGAYVALGASALIPLLHGVQVYGLEYMLEYSGMKWYLVELLLYGGGCGIYAFRIPERIAPGHFDICSGSILVKVQADAPITRTIFGQGYRTPVRHDYITNFFIYTAAISAAERAAYFESIRRQSSKRGYAMLALSNPSWQPHYSA